MDTKTALQAAVEAGNEYIVKLLVQAGADVNMTRRWVFVDRRGTARVRREARGWRERRRRGREREGRGGQEGQGGGRFAK